MWLELCGLPLSITQTAKNPAAWMIFRKIVELDCEAHPSSPGEVETSVAELADRAGVTPDTLHKMIKPLRKMKLLKCFLPDNDDDTAIFKIACPLPVETSRDDIMAILQQAKGTAPLKLRYLDDTDGKETGDEATDKTLREVVDMYLNVVGTRINVFVVDELRLLAGRYPIGAIRKAFAAAKANDIRSLGWIGSHLSHSKRCNNKQRTKDRKAEGERSHD